MINNKDNFYITTPIYYVNGQPHIGHAYTTILADVLSRYQRSLNKPTFFLTGTDEHGQKVQKAAEKENMTPQEQCDKTFVRFKKLWEKLEVTNDYFIRTTDDNHKKVVQEALQELFDKDLIYKDEYEGFYCVPCERFFNEQDLENGILCPECQRETQKIIEGNYFFRMSQYQDWLINYIEENPEFIQPTFRANETLGFLKKQKLSDLCISRPKERLSWGIELPFDAEYVCYVWFDALINYITGIGYKQNDEEFAKWWPASYHLIGKDILTTHTVYWPTMLKAMGLPMPKTIFAHGWWLTGRDKMSKSLGNVVNPMEMCDKYGVDAFRYFLLSEMTLGQDASFTEEAFIQRFNSDLANDLGNLLSRVTKMILRNFDGTIPAPATELAEEEIEFLKAVNKAVEFMPEAIDSMKLDRGIERALAAVRAGNRYLEQTAPWTLAKKGETDKLKTVMYYSANALWKISTLLHSVMPQKMAEMLIALGFNAEEANTVSFENIAGKNDVLSGKKINDPGALFQRIIIEDKNVKNNNQQQKKKQKQQAKQDKKQKNAEISVENGLISIDDFFKTELKVAKVLEAEKVPEADKLLKLQIDVGGEQRQLVAGIAAYYSPEEMIGKTIVIVANLKPAKIRGVKSQGMLLAAKDTDGLKIITVDGLISSGASVG
ncbi:methionine--tRNA ligase [Lentisphaerota bacterium WC36G]|nr:methionine--tRNA ligase [Lentisphaerae bacterium WC36]